MRLHHNVTWVSIFLNFLDIEREMFLKVSQLLLEQSGYNRLHCPS